MDDCPGHGRKRPRWLGIGRISYELTPAVGVPSLERVMDVHMRGFVRIGGQLSSRKVFAYGVVVVGCMIGLSGGLGLFGQGFNGWEVLGCRGGWFLLVVWFF